MACLPFPKNQKNFSLLIIFLHFLQTTEQVSNVGPSKNEKTPTIKCSKCPSSKSRSKTLLVSVKLSDNAILSVLFCLSNVFVYFDIICFDLEPLPNTSKGTCFLQPTRAAQLSQLFIGPFFRNQKQKLLT